MRQTNQAEKIVFKQNKDCTAIFMHEKKKRNVCDEKLARGICSRKYIMNLRNGTRNWTKVTGDILMHRLGVSSDDFDVIASSDEMERWRSREDICRIALEQPEEAERLVYGYRERYKSRAPIEEQFLLRVQTAAMLVLYEAHGDINIERIVSIALEAVECTVLDDWKNGISELCLAPAELEALLLLSTALFLGGRKEEARFLQREVWQYPRIHGWEKRMKALILPQAAIIGIKFCECEEEWKTAFAIGKEALEILRNTYMQCYLIPLMDVICALPGSFKEDAYIQEVRSYRQSLSNLYDRYGCSKYRMWQTISISNTKEAGIVLKMMRNANKMTQEEAVRGFDGEHMSEKQLQKIERGLHKPSGHHYNVLMGQYQRSGEWRQALLETNDADLLILRQQIDSLLGIREWDRAEALVRKFEKTADIREPRTAQALLTWKAIIDWKKQRSSPEECILLLFRALKFTMPDLSGKEMKYWMYERNEGQIMHNIANLFRCIGEPEESEKRYRSLLHSEQMLMGKHGMPSWNYYLLCTGYLAVLGEMRRHEKAAQLAEDTIRVLLSNNRIRGIGDILYEFVWNTYEIASRTPEKRQYLQKRWKEDFSCCIMLAKFFYLKEFEAFLADRRLKYLVSS